MIYETDTNRVLVWDNSAWVMIADSDQPPGLQLVIPSGATNGTLSGSTVTVNSAVSSCTVSGCFSSEFENYRIVISGVDCSGSGSGGYFTFSGSTGSTYQSAAYYMAYTSATLNGTNRNASGDGGLWTVSGTERNDAVIDVFGPNVNAKTTWSVQFTNDLYPGVSQGYDSNTVQHTGFVLKSPAATTLTGGTIRVYGYRN
jgi:hypothetical protein